MKILIGARPSRLAIIQVKEITERFPDLDFELVVIKTKGDRDKVTSLTDKRAIGFFTYDIEKALLNGKIDIAVHSAKDLDGDLPQELVIVAITRSISSLECLISRNNFKLTELPKGSVVGTSSYKRKSSVVKFRADLEVKNIRGNIEERIQQVDSGRFDAIIVAHAALLRLGYQNRIAEIIEPCIIRPHPLQGSLAVEACKDRIDLISIFRSINNE